MKEARLECVIVGGYPLDDLGLTLRQNQVEWLDAEKAKKSRDLKHAKQVGAVQVRFEQRCRVAKKLPDPIRHVPPSVRKSRPTRAAPAQPELAKPEIDMEEVARRAEVAAANASERAVHRAMSKLAPQPGITQGMLEDALRSVLGAGSIQMPFRPVPPSDEDEDDVEPVFIPTGIVPSDAKTSISTETETAEVSGLDDAASALKKARKRVPRKKPTEKK